MAKLSELSKKEKLFIERFVETGNKTQSYKDVYQPEYEGIPNYDDFCYANAVKILKKEKGIEYMQEVRAQYLARVGDKAEFIMRELMDDISYRSPDGKKSPTWAKSLDLLQKQLGLQSQKVDANVNTPNIKITIGEDND